MSEARSELYAAVLRATAAARGLPLNDDDLHVLAGQAAATLDGFRRLAADLDADDDVHSFRRLLEAEAPHG